MTEREKETLLGYARKHRIRPENLSKKWRWKCPVCGETVIMTDIHSTEDENGEKTPVGTCLCPHCLRIMKVRFTRRSEVMFRFIKYERETAFAVLRNLS